MDWAFASFDEGSTAWIVERLWQAGVHIMGSVTYRDMAAHWPSSTEPYAPPMNQIPKVVFSKTLREAAWTDSRIARGSLADEIARLKQEPGRDILAHGGAGFAQSLVKERLIDEYRLLVHPIALGKGPRLFAELDRPMKMRLVDSTRFANGIIAEVYRSE